MLEYEVNPAIRKKRWRVLRKWVISQHKNACPHEAQLQKLDLEVLSHFAYSPDPASFDFYLFAPLQDALSG